VSISGLPTFLISVENMNLLSSSIYKHLKIYLIKHKQSLILGECGSQLISGLTLEGDSGEEVALWLLTSLCTSAKREVEVALILTVKKHRYIFTTIFPFLKPLL
jgi:hypothetical protein